MLKRTLCGREPAAGNCAAEMSKPSIWTGGESLWDRSQAYILVLGRGLVFLWGLDGEGRAGMYGVVMRG